MNKKPSSPNTKKVFEAVLENGQPGMDTAYISIPFDVEKEYGTRGQVKVNATFDGYAYRGVLANMGTGCHQIGVRQDVRQSIGKKIGGKVKVTVALDIGERRVEIPKELQKLFSKNEKAKAFFDTLSFTNRKEYSVWVGSAKKPETKEKRLTLTLEKLLKRKKNPSEK
jgi:hypothetical protein